MHGDMNINLIDSQLFDMAGKLVSCMVSVFIVFRYYDAKYIRTYGSGWIYSGLAAICCFLNFIICLLNHPVMNICFWLAMIFIFNSFFYYGETISKGKYYIINIAFIFLISICEALGVVLVNEIIKIIGISQTGSVISFVRETGGSAIAIIFYYLLIERLFIRRKVERISISQYAIYIIISVYALMNMVEILLLMKHEMNNMDYLFVVVSAVLVIFMNLYLFYLLDVFAENKELKYKLVLYERQARSNYEYYAKQAESRKTAMAVIHDVRKHIQVMENLKQAGAPLEMQSYTNSFEEMIEPLLIKQYCDNAILNVILNDKAEYCEKNGIGFAIDLYDVDIEYMEPIDITTIFGNILDNAIEACEKAEEKNINLKIYPFNKFIYVQLSNTFSGELALDANGRPKSGKGEYHGIGLENVEKVLEAYYGQMTFSMEEGIFTIEILFSQP